MSSWRCGLIFSKRLLYSEMCEIRSKYNVHPNGVLSGLKIVKEAAC